jgi:hypothetical protein
MRRTCNKGLTNPKNKSTQQDLTNKKRREDSGIQAKEIQGKAFNKNQSLLQKSSLIVNLYF